MLESKLGLQTFEADRVIKAGKASKEDATLLGIPKNESMLITDRRLVDMEDNFIELEHAFYRADMYAFKIKLARKNN